MASAFDSESFQELLHTVERYVKNRLMPLEDTVEENNAVPDDVVSEMREMGFFGLGIPQAYGGLELDIEQEMQVQMLFSQTSQAFRLVFWPNVGIGSKGILLAGTEAQKQKYLPRLASGEYRAAFCLTEPEAGSDAGSLRTSAVRDGDDYVINGTKRFITNALHADVFTVMARTDKSKPGADGISAFIVERTTPGLQVGKPEKKMGQRGSSICDVIFENVRVPASAMVGGESNAGKGFRIAMQVLDSGRASVAASAVGLAKRIIDEAARYAMQRRQFGQPIANFQLIQAMLADSEAEYLAGHALAMRAGQALQNGEDARTLAASAKYYCSEMVGRVADRAVQIFGGAGYVAEYPVERLYRDARAMRIYEGTSQVLQLVIAKTMLKRYE
ncbi:acyl-CoA dehydrogenase [Pseudomonas capeferrum]|uniref:acyl-CoA dehydrogenase family protein n=1 Tax=Pseudomonas capeferrum TaxID=1495066 RepID=UPI0015E4443B|nr:acyl-CoA dehydrogenase family protein [Pseudomonas capeferrum]MBA1204830.1 acyl-CoA dehydrogenase [Pseudomonas capeferrum]